MALSLCRSSRSSHAVVPSSLLESPRVDPGLGNIVAALLHTVREYPQDQQDELRQALMEAWVWLEREGLLVPKPGSQGEWVVISRRGRQLRTRDQVHSYRRANRLPRHQLHPRIAQKVWASFLRGDYDTAVFQAFKEVEVRVREAAQYADTDLGVGLMRKAFGESGPLADAAAHRGRWCAVTSVRRGPGHRDGRRGMIST